MLGWFKKKFTAELHGPLEGAPAVRRQKTYQSQSGFVYQYYFAGSRRAESELGSGYEFIFPVSADRKTEFLVAVQIGDAGIAAWEREHGRELLSKERYAVAKMALFAAFDERETPDAMRLPVLADTGDVARFLEHLGRG
jgi:hypothetical protein